MDMTDAEKIAAWDRLQVMLPDAAATVLAAIAAPADLFGASANLPVVVSTPLHERVAEAYLTIAKAHKGVAGLRGLDDGRKRLIAARGKDAVKLGAESPEAGWAEVFDRIHGSRFLLGLSEPGRGRERPFRLALDWLLNSSNFRKVIEGKYDDPVGGIPTRDDRTGREYGPAEQAAREAARRVQARREQSDGRA